MIITIIISRKIEISFKLASSIFKISLKIFASQIYIYKSLKNKFNLFQN